MGVDLTPNQRNSPLPTPSPGGSPALVAHVPDQGLLTCELCRAINLPNSYYCCQCGEPLAGGPLDLTTRREVEELLRSAVALDPTAPVLLDGGDVFNSHCYLETMSLWPAALAAADFINDPWQRQALLLDARVLVTDAAQSQTKDWLPLLEAVLQANEPLVVVAGRLAGEVVATLRINNSRGILRCAALLLTPPADVHSLLLEDVACVLQTNVVTAAKLARTAVDRLPQAREIRANLAYTVARGLAAMAPPSSQGDSGLTARRNAIYGRQAVCLKMGVNSRASVQARIRHAARLLTAGTPATGAETQAAPTDITTRAP
jgi:hypothetical protein